MNAKTESPRRLDGAEEPKGTSQGDGISLYEKSGIPVLNAWHAGLRALSRRKMFRAQPRSPLRDLRVAEGCPKLHGGGRM